MKEDLQCYRIEERPKIAPTEFKSGREKRKLRRAMQRKLKATKK